MRGFGIFDERAVEKALRLNWGNAEHESTSVWSVWRDSGSGAIVLLSGILSVK